MNECLAGNERGGIALGAIGGLTVVHDAVGLGVVDVAWNRGLRTGE